MSLRQPRGRHLLRHATPHLLRVSCKTLERHCCVGVPDDDGRVSGPSHQGALLCTDRQHARRHPDERAHEMGVPHKHRRLGHATSGGVVHSPQANRLITRCRRYAQLACLRYCTHVFAVAPELRSQVKGLDGEGQTDGTVSEGSIGGRCACSHERTAWSTSIAFLRWGD